MPPCCISGFSWAGTPQGKEEKLGNLNTYVAGDPKSDVAILYIHDLFGWKFPNARLLADHFAAEVDAAVYVPDFFDGEEVPEDTMADPEKQAKFDFTAWFSRQNKELRGPEVFEAARILKQERGFKKVGAIGYCWGGWAAFQLGAKDRNLIACLAVAHPSFLTKPEIAALGVPAQILAPEHDPVFTPDLKAYCHETIPAALGLEYDYQYFPRLAHGFATRGDAGDKAQRDGLERAKNAAAGWFATMLRLQSE